MNQQGKLSLQLKSTAHQVISSLSRNFRPLLIYHLFFSVLAVMLLTPVTAWLSTKLLTTSGHPMVSHQEILGFILSPAGLIWILATAVLTVLLLFLHHAGMILINAQSGTGHYRLATLALWRVGRNLPRLLQLAAIQVGVHLLLAAPFLLALAGAWVILLEPYDPYYPISEKPRIFWIFLGIAALLGTGILICNGFLYIRWFLALPALLLEKTSPLTALKRSSRLSRGYMRRMAVLLVGLALLVFFLPVLFTLLFEGLGGIVLGWLPENFAVLVPAVLIYISAYIVLTILGSYLGIATNSLLIHQIYQNISGITPVQPDPSPPARSGMLAWSAELLLLFFALFQAGFVLHSFFDFRDEVDISAHRGSSMKAPENTLPAIEQAIRDGADYVEIDVRQTADNVPVLFHDRDLRRIAGEPHAIWELTLDEVREIDAGEWFHPDFQGVGIPTLEEVIEVVRGRAKLYLEIKPSPHTPELTNLVVEVLREQDFLEDVLIGALHPDVLREVRELEPGLRTSLFVHTAIGDPDRELLDALGLRAAITSVQDIQKAHRHGHELHVWTVNDRREMSRFIDMGVDNIITDRPDVLADLLRERAELSSAELFLIKLRHWLQD